MKKTISVEILLFLVVLVGPGSITNADNSELVAYFPFDGNALDFSTNSNHGIEFGGVTYSPGISDSAAEFDGNSGFIQLPSSVIGAFDQLTIAAWVNFSSPGLGFWPAVLGSYSGNNPSLNNGIYLQATGTNRFQLEVTTDVVPPNPSPWPTFDMAGTPINFNEWIHIALVYDGTELIEYINGIRGASRLAEGQIIPADDVTVGRLTNYADFPNPEDQIPAAFSYYLDGFVDELYVFSSALTESELDDLIENGIQFDEDNDGVPDESDICENSIVTQTVFIRDQDSGVVNTVDATGCSISDLIDLRCSGDFRNHGQFVSCISKATNDLKTLGIISGKDKGAIQQAAAQSKN